MSVLGLNDHEEGAVKKLRLGVIEKVIAALLVPVLIWFGARAYAGVYAVYLTVPEHQDLLRGPLDVETGKRRAGEGLVGRVKAIEDRGMSPELQKRLSDFLDKKELEQAASAPTKRGGRP